MEYAIVELLTWASASSSASHRHRQQSDRIAAVPIGVDPGRDAFEVWIR
ncbi:MAG: hypothetical protein R2882_08710 [Gemmatimonadales bacterium]